MSKLTPALRQYRHNTGDDFVFGYDVEETNAIVNELEDKLLEAMRIVNQVAHIGYGEFSIPEHTIQEARDLSTRLVLEALN